MGPAAVRAPGFARIRALSFSLQEGHAVLARSPGAASIVRLSLAASAQGPVQELAQVLPGALSSVQALTLRGEAFDAACLSALLRGLPSLRELALSWAPLDDEGARALAAMPELSRLSSLSLCSCRVGADGLAALRARLGEDGVRA